MSPEILFFGDLRGFRVQGLGFRIAMGHKVDDCRGNGVPHSHLML